MPQRWIVTVSEDNLEGTLKHKLIGLPETRRSSVKGIRTGDTIVFYIGKKRAGYGGPKTSVSQFGHVAEVTGEYYVGNERIWMSRSKEVFLCRVPITVISEGRVGAAEVIPQLDFVRDKRKWGLHFLTGIRRISERDYETLLAAIAK